MNAVAVGRLDAKRPVPGGRLDGYGTLVWAFVRRDAAIAWSYRLPFWVGVVQSVLVLGMLYFLGHLVGRHVRATEGLTGG